MAKVTERSDKLIARLTGKGMSDQDAGWLILRQVNEGRATLSVEGDIDGRWARQLREANPSDLMARLRNGYINEAGRRLHATVVAALRRDDRDAAEKSHDRALSPRGKSLAPELLVNPFKLL